MKRLIRTLFVVSIIPLTILQPASSCSRNATHFQQEPSTLHSFGSQFYARGDSKYHVDKTALLKILFDEEYSGEEGPVLITMPKRFGKTTNLKMIAAFSEIEVDSETGLPIAENPDKVTNTPNYKLFTGKHKFGEFGISKDVEFMTEHFGKYPVIYLDLIASPDVKNAEDVAEHCKLALHNAYSPHEYLMRSPRLNDQEKLMVKYWRNMGEYPQTDTHSGRVEFGLANLITYLYQHFRRPVVVLIDEFDTLLQGVLRSNLKDAGVITSVLNPFINMLTRGLKSQAKKLQLSVITGVTYYGSAGLISAVPLRRYLFARNDDFWPYFGFTSTEVDRLLEISPLNSTNSTRETVDNYYKGYLAGTNNNCSIYAPRSIRRFLTQQKIGRYWSEESSTIMNFWKALRIYEIRRHVHDLVDGKSIVIENVKVLQVSDILLLKDIIETEYMKSVGPYEVSLFFNFILDLGYLRILSTNSTHCTVDIPNGEIHEDILQYLTIYRSNTEEDEEIKLQRQFLQGLTLLKVEECEIQLQDMTDALNNLCAIVMPRIPRFEEEDLKEILRDIFRRAGINCYREVRTVSPIRPKNTNNQPNYVKLDLLLTNLTSAYVFIETKYAGNPETALNQIIDLYLPLKNSSEYPMTQPYYLMLGINLSSQKTISVAASFRFSNDTSIFNKTLIPTAH
ncbi:uncharacterized protein LOC135842810 [Planococcus citri]|uniref:uncharacterized protein LOC135842810 n=1 Tax=Planococcus citri TaxID=170843 RepID=UPI0031F8FF64